MENRFFYLTIFAISSLMLLSGCPGSGEDTSENWEWTHTLDFGRCPKWSPQGEIILFGDDTPGRAGIYLWDLSSAPTSLAETLPIHNWDYSWSPDGSKIAWTSPGAQIDSSIGVWLYELSTGNVRRIFNYGRDVCWLSDNITLVVRIDEPIFGAPGIYTLERTEQEYEYNAFLLAADGFKPTASPKAGWLTYLDHEFKGRLHLLDPEGDQQHVSGQGVMVAKWSADGSRLAYARNNYGYKEDLDPLWDALFVVGISNPAKADSLTAWATNPAPSPDGSQIVFSRVQFSQWAGLFIYRPESGNVRIAPYGLTPDYDPNGDRVVVGATVGGIRVLTRVR